MPLLKTLIDLMQENMTLRNLLRGLSTFIGEGAGGLLPKLGWDVSDFNTYLNRSETDTAWEGYHRDLTVPQKMPYKIHRCLLIHGNEGTP